MATIAWTRVGGVVAVVVGIIGGWAGSHGAAAFALTGPCHNLDPATTGNALTATPNDARPWDQIQSVAIAAGPTLVVNAGSFGGSALAINQLQITLTTCATSVPSFPIATVAGSAADTGAQWQTCIEADHTEPIVSAPNGMVIGFDPDTQSEAPLNDGPYPANQGWRFCAFASLNAGESPDSGVSIFDVLGHGVYTEYDLPFLCDNASNLGAGQCNRTFTPATYTVGSSGFFTVTMNIPYDVVVSTPDLVGNGNGNGNLTTVEPWIRTGDTVSDPVAEATVAIDPDLPGTVCVPVQGCVQGIYDFISPVDWLPGYEVCPTPSVGCSKLAGSGLDLGLGYAAHRVAVNTINPCLGPADSCVAERTGVGANGVPWEYQFVYGRLPYGEIAGSGALLNNDPAHSNYTWVYQYEDYPGDTFTG